MSQKTMAVRVDEDVHARLTLLARLNKRSLAEEMLEAITNHLSAKWSDENLAAQAQEALAEIDREATTRRQAIEGLLRSEKPQAPRKSGKR